MNKRRVSLNDNCKEEYIYKKTHLPKEGWLHGCFRCWEITGDYHFYKNNHITNIKYFVYLCSKCHEKIYNNPERKCRYEAAYDRHIQFKKTK